MASALFVLAILAPVLGLVLLVGSVISAFAALLGRPARRRQGWWPRASVASLGAFGLIYGWGFFIGSLFDFRPTTEYCAGKPLASPQTTSSLLPLENTCRWADGSSTNLVPGYVNPLLFLALAGTVACAGAAAWSYRRTKRAHHSPVPTRESI